MVADLSHTSKYRERGTFDPVPVRQLFRALSEPSMAKVFLDLVWYFYIFWFPAYLKQARHFRSGFDRHVCLIPFMVAAWETAGGWLAGALLRRNIPTIVARKSSDTICPFDAIRYTGGFDPISEYFDWASFSGYAGLHGSDRQHAGVPGRCSRRVWWLRSGLASMGSGFYGMVFARDRVAG
jgi:ACS family hexuronate transporter-like MFS transporter